jgi:hypothetical protein
METCPTSAFVCGNISSYFQSLDNNLGKENVLILSTLLNSFPQIEMLLFADSGFVYFKLISIFFAY